MDLLQGRSDAEPHGACLLDFSLPSQHVLAWRTG